MTIATLILGILLQIGRPPRVLQSPLESRARDFVTNFNAVKFDVATKDFNESLRAVLGPTELESLRELAYASLGDFRSITGVRQRREGGFRIVEVICKYEKSLGSVRIVFDSLDRIGAVYIDPIANEPVEPVLEAAARGFLKNFVAGDFEAATRHFERNLQAQLPPSKLAKLQAQVKSSYGAFRSVKEVHQLTEELYRTLDVTAVYERSSVLIHIAFNSSDRMTGIKLEPIAPEP
jgi:hypothetical protein